MDNQHKLIKGCRDLSEDEISQMNNIKETGQTLETMIKSMRNSPDLDQRWVSIAETHLQQGIMAAVRSVAKPGSF